MAIVHLVTADYEPLRQDFERRVGRPARLADRIRCAWPRPVLPSQHTDYQDGLQLLDAAESPPQIVYAFQKTGCLLGHEGMQRMAPPARAAYLAAIEEYFALCGCIQRVA